MSRVFYLLDPLNHFNVSGGSIQTLVGELATVRQYQGLPKPMPKLSNCCITAIGMTRDESGSWQGKILRYGSAEHLGPGDMSIAGDTEVAQGVSAT